MLYEDIQFEDRLLSPLQLTEGVSFSDSVEIHRSPLPVKMYALSADEKVTLAWTKQSDPRANPMTDYVIEQSNDNGMTWNEILDGVDSTRAYTVEPGKHGAHVMNGVNSLFRVQAVNSIGQSIFSAPEDATPESDDNEYVRNVTIQNLPEKFKVTWEPHPDYEYDFVDYQIFYATKPDGPFTLHDDGYGAGYTKYPIAQHPSGPSVTIDEISEFEPIFVKIQPVLGTNNGCPADEDEGPGASQLAWAMPQKQPPKKILVNEIFAVPGDDYVTLEWEKPQSKGSEILYYDIRYGMKMPGMAVTFGYPYSIYPVADSFDWYEYEVDYLAGSTEYHFQIRGINNVDYDPNNWSDSKVVTTKEHKVEDYSRLVWWGDDYIDNDKDGMVDEYDEQKMGAPEIADDFDYSAEGVQYGDNQAFDGTQDFGVGQTFGDGTQFHAGQTFDDDVNFSGKNINFNGANFQNAETFGDGAAFTGTQSFTGTNTFGDSVVFDGAQNFGSATQTLW